MLAYTPLERLNVRRPVDRIPFIADRCTGKRVLDLGAMDETAYAAKKGQGSWLHEEIGRTASRVIGIDNSALVPTAGMRTGPNAVIHRAALTEIGPILRAADFSPDIVVAGELIEHLENPLDFLRSLKATESLRGKTLYVTTPNATAIHNVLIGLLSRESTHRDHLCVLSFKTLCTLFRRSGFDEYEIVPYVARFTEMKARNAGLRRTAVRTGELCINALERMFPLLSFGYIVQALI